MTVAEACVAGFFGLLGWVNGLINVGVTLSACHKAIMLTHRATSTARYRPKLPKGRSGEQNKVVWQFITASDCVHATLSLQQKIFVKPIGSG
jgi:hypothetical protein